MRRCDVDCSEYLARYETSEMRGALLGHDEAVSSSLSLSLNAIQEENRTAWEALRLIGWLGPDQITKKLLRSNATPKSPEKFNLTKRVDDRKVTYFLGFYKA
jgi:hypothetical protein